MGVWMDSFLEKLEKNRQENVEAGGPARVELQPQVVASPIGPASRQPLALPIPSFQPRPSRFNPRSQRDGQIHRDHRDRRSQCDVGTFLINRISQQHRDGHHDPEGASHQPPRRTIRSA